MNFKHNFQDSLTPLCLCGNGIKTSTHNLLYCVTYTNERLVLLDKITCINWEILELSQTVTTKILLFGDNYPEKQPLEVFYNKRCS